MCKHIFCPPAAAFLSTAAETDRLPRSSPLFQPEQGLTELFCCLSLPLFLRSKISPTSKERFSPGHTRAQSSRGTFHGWISSGFSRKETSSSLLALFSPLLPFPKAKMRAGRSFSVEKCDLQPFRSFSSRERAAKASFL